MINTPKDYGRYLSKVSKLDISHHYDIPYTAGYNWEGNRVYIDRDIPKTVTIKEVKIDLHKSLAMHEFVEKCMINKGYTYAAAHQIATKYERAYVESCGITWKDYDRTVAKLMHFTWISKWKSIPVDLDMTPMEYSRDIKTLAKIRRLLRVHKRPPTMHNYKVTSKGLK